MVKFADEAFVIVSSGKGGNGCVAFRREKYVPMGGPSGGDGGRGGSIIFEIRRNLRTLAHVRYKQSFKAKNGGDGQGSQRYGKDGDDCIIPLPPGCVLRDAETGDVIKDFGLDTEGTFVFLEGGNGGWGNVHFKGATNQAPRTALPGKPGETRRLRIELNIIADIGFVGFPNAGKSSLLEYFTNARPKIAPYPFTTKIPNLGVLRVNEEQDIILADIPGIIEGASDGHGMGIKFLKHILRTSGLAFLIDLSDDDYCDSYEKLQKELDGFSPLLAEKPRVVIANKLDLPDTRERLAELRARYPEQRIFGISVHSRWGLDEVRDAFIAMVNDSINGDVTDGNDQIPDFMQAEPEEVPNPLPELDSDDFGATVSLNRKKRRRTR
ncbi:MAG TPA: GTPase ObgE [Treponemataceae bacterium]|nr:GTPase ObgE [Treponemataceae bacterium]HOS34540.1 GTPase ObgE [Treponemataceae bacterium]